MALVITPTDGQVRSVERGLLSYLLLPRFDSWIKWTIAPAAYLVTAAATGHATETWRLPVLVVVLELLIYQARYQWNDVRGYTHDIGHAERNVRGRLPSSTTVERMRRHVVASLLTMTARLLAAIGVGVLVDRLAVVTAIIGGLALVAVSYEILRALPVRGEPTRLTARTLGLWLLVGMGYAIRAALGFWAAGAGMETAVGALGFAFFTAYGMMFVMLSWVLDATSHDRSAEGLRRAYHASKPHTAVLLRYLAAVDGPVHAPLNARGAIRAPWNVFLVLALVLGTVLGFELAGVTAWWWALPLGVCGGGLVAVAGGTRSRLLADAGGVAAVAGCAAALGADPLWVPMTPWIFCLAIYTGFRRSSYFELRQPLQGIVRPVRRVVTAAARLIMGSATWHGLAFDERRPAVPTTPQR